MPNPNRRERMLEKFPALLEVQLHGFGGEVDELFDLIDQEVEIEVVEQLKLEHQRIRDWAAANVCEGEIGKMAMEDVGRNFILLKLAQFLSNPNTQ